MKVNFLVAGAQKSGTTALWTFLRQHPLLQFGRQKELHFFDNETLNWTSPSYDLLHAEFAQENTNLLFGDATPIYSYWKPSMARIHAYNPKMKFILIFRDPAHRAYSHWRMEVTRAAETMDFSQAIRAGRSRVLQLAEIDGCQRVFSYVERGFYAEQIERVLSFFPPQQVLLLKQSDLRTYHADVLDKICDFLSVDRFRIYPRPDNVFSHEGKGFAPMSGDDRKLLLDIFKSDLRAMERIYGLSLLDQHGN